MSRACSLLLVGVLGLLLVASTAMAREKQEKSVPDVTGVWKGESESVAAGKLGHTEPSETPKFLRVQWTLTIDKQEGRVFYGSKASARGRETVVGVIDGATLTMADDDGVYIGKLTSKNRMIVKYAEAGKESKVASITHYAREDAADKAAPAAQ